MKLREAHRLRTPLAFVAAVMLALLPTLSSTRAATPTGGSLTTTSGPVTYTGGPYFVGNVDNLNGIVCGDAAHPCDDFALNVSVPAGTDISNQVKVQISWPNTAADFDLYVLDAAGHIVAQSASSRDPEIASLPAVSASYTVRVVPYNPLGQSFNGNISLAPKDAAGTQSTGIAPRYQNFAAPGGLGTDAGEPSLGSNWVTGAAFFQSYRTTLKVNFDDSTSPAKATWTDVSAPVAKAAADPLGDPIGFVDHTSATSNRVFEDQLNFGTSTSLMEFSDKEGASGSWTPSQGGGLASGVDHQTVGGGPFVAGSPEAAVATYPHAIYYCAQSIAEANCALSTDGGLTFGAAVPIWSVLDCAGLHGHVKVAPDGTVYVPNKNCGGKQGVAVSTDNGKTWTVRTVPGSTRGRTDPSVGIGADSTLYFGYANGDGHPHLVVSHDRGITWTHDSDVGAPYGIQNTAFPALVGGDASRAAFAWHGTSTGGDMQDKSVMSNAVWHLYITTTLDGGATWTTVDATPNDPVQRGSICVSGPTCGNDRNLLDFFDATVDKQGRVLVGYADGCIAGCVVQGPNSYSQLATIARQSGGPRLFGAYDPVEPSVPAKPSITATKSSPSSSVNLAWSAPDNGGSAITTYNIYKGTRSGGERLLASTAKNNYTDTAVKPNKTYFYQVSAVNSVGEGPRSNEVSPVVVVQQSPCTPPGVTVVTDPTGDQVGAPANADLDIQEVDVAEPRFADGSNNLVFTMKVDNLTTLVPNRQWKIIWNFTGGPRYYAGMSTDATGHPTFDYGRVADTTNAPTSIAPAGAGSGYATDGTITIVVPNSGVGNPVAGNTLGSVQGRTFDGQGNVTITQSASVDYTSSNPYTLAGNASCP